MTIRRAVCLLALLLSSACHPVPASDALELHTYDVPEGTVRSLVSVVKDVLWVSNNAPPLGRATITPDGRLAVVAPRSVQAGVQSIVDEVARHPPKPEKTIELDYWLVAGRASAAPVPLPQGTQEIASALTEIQRGSGPLTFGSIEKVHLSTLNDEEGTVEAENLKIRQRAVRTATGVFADVHVDLVHNPGRLETRVVLAPDQVLVLAATRPEADGGGADGATLYYLLRLAPHTDGRQP